MEKIKIKKKCRLCNSLDITKVFNLCKSPPANNLALTKKSSLKVKKYPLNLMFCNNCKHVQLQHVINKNLLFDKYLYMSGLSNQFRIHFKKFSEKAIKKFPSKKNLKVLEIGSNDCTLLNYFNEKKCLTVGIEPAKNLYELTKNKHHIFNSFYNKKINKILLKKYKNFDLIIANNVFAHIDNLKEVFINLQYLMNKQSLIIFEVSYLLDVINNNLFDTIYHEHLDYHSIFPLIDFFKKINLKIIDIDKVKMHGGSIRLYLSKEISLRKINMNKINKYIKIEKLYAINKRKKLIDFYFKIEKEKNKLSVFFEKNKKDIIYGYGAPAKVVTLINYFNLNHNNINLIVDDSKIKQNKYIPGTKIKILNSRILDSKPPKFIIIFAWNIYKDILKKLKNFKKVQFIVIPLPKFKVIKLL